MESESIIKENWLTRKPPKEIRVMGFNLTLFLSFLLMISTLMFRQDLYNANQWMPASGELVFGKHEYWRLWTTLFAHSDLGHILSNLLLFFPFSYFLIIFYGAFFFPIVGFLVGGIANLIVLKTMPEQVYLIGVSGVVYWMGAAWVTLSLLIDRRGPTHRRVLKTIGISAMLFLPDSYKPEVSYLSHLAGYAFGIVSALIYYYFNRKRFQKAEIIEVVCAEPEELPLPASNNMF